MINTRYSLFSGRQLKISIDQLKKFDSFFLPIIVADEVSSEKKFQVKNVSQAIIAGGTPHVEKILHVLKVKKISEHEKFHNCLTNFRQIQLTK